MPTLSDRFNVLGMDKTGKETVLLSFHLFPEAKLLAQRIFNYNRERYPVVRVRHSDGPLHFEVPTGGE